LRAVGRYLAALGRALRADPEALAEGRHDRYPVEGQAGELWQAVRRLSGPDQEIVYLRYFLELSEAEAAQAIEVAVGTVKSRAHRALGRLRAIVEKDFPTLRELIE
jgi:RNA polymerase sigma-70 factor (ECF subfamily)